MCRKQTQLTKRLVDIAASFIKVLVENDEDNKYTKEVISAFITGSKITTWLSNVTTIVLYAEVVAGNLSVVERSFDTLIGQKTVKIDLDEQYPIDNVEECVRWASFNVKLLKKLFSKNEDRENPDDDDDSKYVEALQDNSMPIIKDTLTNILYVIAAGYLYGRHYTSVSLLFYRSNIL